MYTPSIIAAASIAAALEGLDWTGKSGCSLNQLLDRLHVITAIERVSQKCLRTGCQGECLDLRGGKWRVDSEKWMVKSFRVCMSHC